MYIFGIRVGEGLMKKLGVLCFMILVFGAAAKADSGFPTYDVQGTVTLVGNNVCAGACVETLNFNIEYTFTTFIPGQFLVDVLASSTTSSGPLESFSSFSLGEDNFSGAINAGGDEIDLNHEGGPYLTLNPIQFTSADLFGCGTQICDTDFEIPPFLMFGYFGPATLQDSTTQVAEPGSFVLLVLGLSSLAPFAYRRGLRESSSIAPAVSRPTA